VVVDQLAAPVDRVFAALADPTRRDLLVRAAGGEESVSALARRYPMSLPAVQKHVLVLERAGLVEKRRSGREQLVRTRPEALAGARAALDRLEGEWRDRITRFGEVLADVTAGGTP
jgi:DNA-binding transcriptional ArsR family regulator